MKDARSYTDHRGAQEIIQLQTILYEKDFWSSFIEEFPQGKRKQQHSQSSSKYCVTNLKVALLPKFVKIIIHQNSLKRHWLY